MVQVLDSFEDGDISEYSGDTGEFSVVQSPVYDGSNALENTTSQSAITRTDTTIETGQTPSGAFVQSISGQFSDSTPTVAFGVQSSTGYDNISCYAIEYNNIGELVISRYDSGSRSSLNSSGLSNALDGEWVEVILTEWDTDGNITAEAKRVSDGTTLASVSVTDSTYTSGGIGFINTDADGAYFDYAYKPTAISPPQNVQFNDTQTEDELTLDWTEDDAATGYYVYRAESSGSTTNDYTQVADVTAPPYTDTGLEDGEQFYYRVSSHD